jgi:serine/threonine protein kinase
MPSDDRRRTYWPGGKKDLVHLPQTENEDHGDNWKRVDHAPVSMPEHSAQSFPPRRVSRSGVLRISCFSKSPWDQHDPMITVSHTGEGTVALKGNPRGKRVFIKEITARKQEDLTAFNKLVSHENILPLTAAYFHNDSIYLVYNYLPVTLQEMILRYLTTVQIATVCAAIANGLDYLHRELAMTHGKLHPGNVVVGREGEVKIGKSSLASSLARILTGGT